jgi:hypothetical protein
VSAGAPERYNLQTPGTPLRHVVIFELFSPGLSLRDGTLFQPQRDANHPSLVTIATRGKEILTWQRCFCSAGSPCLAWVLGW